MVGNGNGHRFNNGGHNQGRSDGSQRPPFNSQRRNAVYGNLRFYKAPRGNASNNNDENSNDRPTTIDNTSFRQRNRVTFKHTSNSRFKFNNREIGQKVWKDEDNDTIMNNNEGTSASLNRDMPQRNPSNMNKRIVRNIQFKTQNIARITVKNKHLKIGDTNPSQAKPFPVSQPFCKLKIIDQNVFDLCVKFLQQYFTCFDKYREELLAAYHKKAIFSLAVNSNSRATVRNATFGEYFRDSRNLSYVPTADKAQKMLHVGNIDIVAFLNKFSATEHDCNSLKLDTSFFMDNMLKLSVIGIFKEGKPDEKIRPMRSFQRVFICVPAENGSIAIVNDQWSITNLSFDQSKIYKEEASKSQMEVIPVTVATTSAEVMPSSSGGPIVSNQDQEKQLMVSRFNRETNLTLNWSRDCLEYADWNYNKALTSFMEHKKDIPPEAFVR